jgi:hypothetical protein
MLLFPSIRSVLCALLFMTVLAAVIPFAPAHAQSLPAAPGLTVKDLPDGFVTLAEAEIPGMEINAREDLAMFTSHNFFVNKRELIFLMGATAQVGNGAEQVPAGDVDSLLASPLMLASALYSGAQGVGAISNIHELEVAGVGDAAAGVSATMDMDGFLTPIQALVFRQGDVVGLLFTMQLAEMETSLDIAAVAKQWDRRIVRESVEAAAPEAKGKAAPPITALVTAGKLNVRQGPGTTFGINGQVSRGDELTVTAQSGNCAWIEIRGERGLAGWVAARHVQLDAACVDIPSAK